MALPALPSAENALGSVVDGVTLVNAAHMNDLRRYVEALALTDPRYFPNNVNGVKLSSAGGVELLGTARRKTVLAAIEYLGTVGAVGSSTFGGEAGVTTATTGATTVGAAAVGGVILLPTMLPPDLALDEVVEVYAIVQNGGAGVATGNLVWQLGYDIARDAAAGITETAGAFVTLAGPTAVNGISAQLVATIAANTFSLLDLVTFQLRRIGSDGSDTYDQTIKMHRGLFVIGKRKQV